MGMMTNFATENFAGGSLFKFMGKGPKEGSGVSQGGISVVIDALSKQGRVEIVSQPRVKILNNQVAVIQVGSTQSFVNHSTTQVTQTGTVTSLSTSQVQEGVTMRLLGNIVGEEIYLSVAPVITTIDKIRTINSGNTVIEAPQTTTKSINTLVKVKEGESIAIGGLITSNQKKNKQDVPVVSKIPFLGRLFQYTEDSNYKRELVIFITPKRG
jgi:type II secretory pathway component GspD/PulD (secretin)